MYAVSLCHEKQNTATNQSQGLATPHYPAAMHIAFRAHEKLHSRHGDGDHAVSRRAWRAAAIASLAFVMSSGVL